MDGTRTLASATLARIASFNFQRGSSGIRARAWSMSFVVVALIQPIGILWSGFRSETSPPDRANCLLSRGYRPRRATTIARLRKPHLTKASLARPRHHAVFRTRIRNGTDYSTRSDSAT